MLDVLSVPTSDSLEQWAANIRTMRAELGWPEASATVRVHESGAALAFAAPEDQLYTATEVNEWAWQSLTSEASVANDMAPLAPGHPALWDFKLAALTLHFMARAEQQPTVMALLEAADQHGLPLFRDDENLSIGAGLGSQTWIIEALPEPDKVPWHSLCDIPKALITGSNGKTTTVRLVAAMCASQGLTPGFNCTDGIFVGGECVELGDYSGPGGARTVLRNRRVQSAILEVARGGILRRGLAVRGANVAAVTNISPDHFGEYGVHSLSDLADAKLVVARALGQAGLLVLNADDVTLIAKSKAVTCSLAWFALEHSHPQLMAHRALGGRTCAVVDGRLVMNRDGAAHDLGLIHEMPLTAGGAAHYNIANIAGAVLVASALGVSPSHIAQVLARFGASRHDNPGRLERWTLNELEVLVDYAHNPEGLAGLLAVATQIRHDHHSHQSHQSHQNGRLGLLLGQAGNREEEAIRSLAQTAAGARPDRVVLKDLDSYLRGREPGEVPSILRDELMNQGLPEDRVITILSEVEAVRSLLAWARPGDVLVLPVHTLAAREQVATWLDHLDAQKWVPGNPLMDLQSKE